MAIIIEKFDSREATFGIDSPSVDLQFMVLGTELDAEVRALVQATIPAIYANLVFQNDHIAHQGGGVWEVSVRYGKLEPKVVDVSSCRLRTPDCPTEDWEIAFKFAASPNATDLTVGDITGIEKKGWEYLWVRYADAEDEETLIKQPVAAYVERVYEYGNFALLGIGV